MHKIMSWDTVIKEEILDARVLALDYRLFRFSIIYDKKKDQSFCAKVNIELFLNNQSS